MSDFNRDIENAQSETSHNSPDNAYNQITQNSEHLKSAAALEKRFLSSAVDQAQLGPIIGTDKSGKIHSLLYADGTSSRLFNYDANGQLTVMTVLPDNTIFTRQNSSNIWLSNKGKQEIQNLSVSNEGHVSFDAPYGVTHLIHPSGCEESIYPQHTPMDFPLLFEKYLPLLDKYDGDIDGAITIVGLDNAVQDPLLKGDAATFVKAMRDNFWELMDLNQELNKSYKVAEDNEIGLTLADNERIQNKQLQEIKDAEATNYLMRNFDDLDYELDKDHLQSRSLTPNELKIVLEDPAISPDIKARVEELQAWQKEQSSKQASLTSSSSKDQDIFIGDINTWYEDKNYYVSEVNNGLEDSFSNYPKAMQDVSHELYANKDNPILNIRPEAIVQGQVGDCYFLAAVASAAKFKPEVIKSLIQPTTLTPKEAFDLGLISNQDLKSHRTNNKCISAYTVTFPRVPEEPVTILPPTELELATYTRATSDGIFGPVLAKALGQYLMQHKSKAAQLKAGDILDPYSQIPEEYLDGGSNNHFGLYMLTTKNISEFKIQDPSQEGLPPELQDAQHLALEHKLHQVLPDAIKNAVAITATTDKLPEDVHVRGLVEDHEYSVLDYNPATQMLTLRNPHGEGEPRYPSGSAVDGIDDGKFEISLSDYVQWFSTLAIAN